MKTIAQNLQRVLTKTGKLPMYFFLATIFMTGTASSCFHEDHHDDDDGSSSSSTISAVNSTVSSGTWKVVSFIDSDNDETSHFQSYEFTFGDNGELTATDGTTVVSGNWSVTNSSGSSRHGSDDNSSSDIDFNIFFASPSNFAELSEDWEIVLRTSTRIELVHVSGGNGGTDLLTFEKI